MKTVAIIGANGQLGTDLCEIFSRKQWRIIPLTRKDVDVENVSSVEKVFSSYSFEWLINTAAFHNTRACELDSQKAWEVNALAQKNILRLANSHGSKVVYVSTDYVFNGEINRPYSTSDLIGPINVYGHSKAGGEIATLSSSDRNIVFRISSVFGRAGSGGKGGNFLETILQRARAGESISVVDDITMSPTYAKDASVILENALRNDFSGILHGVNLGEATWFEFAQYALTKVGISAEIAVSSTDWSAPLKRPRYSVLDSSVTTIDFGPIPTWQHAVDRYLSEKGHI